MIARSLGELADEFGDALTITTLNADDNPLTARAYGVMSLPTLLFFRNGELVDRIVGARPKTQLRQAMSAHL
jgi:thioredoxin 1